MNTQVVIRRFDGPRDAQALRECIIEQQNVHRAIESTWPDGDAIVSDYLTYLTAERAAHNGCIFIAQYGEQMAGFVCVVATLRSESPDDPAPFAWIHDLYVRPEHRRQGVASRLMAEAERFARDEGAHTMRLGVLDGNEPARRFYATGGFRDYTHVLTKPLS